MSCVNQYIFAPQNLKLDVIKKFRLYHTLLGSGTQSNKTTNVFDI